MKAQQSDSRGDIQSLIAYAHRLGRAAKLDSAHFCLDSALTVSTGIKDWPLVVTCLRSIGNLLQNQRRLAEADSVLSHALEIGRRELGDTYDELDDIYNVLGILRWRESRLEEALDYHRSALQLRVKSYGSDQGVVAQSHNNLALVYFWKGEFDEAENHYRKSLAIELKNENHYGAGLCYANLALLYNETGDPDKGLEACTNGLSSLREVLPEDHPHISGIYSHLGHVYDSKKDYQESLRWHSKSLELRIKALGPDAEETGSSLINIGGANIHLGYHDKAEEALKRAYDIFVKIYGEDHPEVAGIVCDLGIVCSRTGRYEEAWENYLRAKKIHETIGGPRSAAVAGVLDEMAKLCMTQGRFDQALAYYHQAVLARTKICTDTDVLSNPSFEDLRLDVHVVGFLHHKANALVTYYDSVSSRLGVLSAAFETYALASLLVDRLRTSLWSEESKLLLGIDAHELHENAIETALRLFRSTGDRSFLRSAFLFAERQKAATLWTAIVESGARTFGGVPDSLLVLERSIKRQLNRLELELEEADEDSSRIHENLAGLRAEHAVLSDRHDRLVMDFSQRFPTYHEAKYKVAAVGIEELQASMSPTEALIEFFLGERSLIAFAITRDTIGWRMVSLDTSFNEDVSQYLRSLKKREKESYVKYAHRLHDRLVNPFGRLLADMRHVTIIPDGILHNVPFESLLEKAVDADRTDFRKLPYLISRWSISYDYSATLHANRINRTGDRASGFLGLAPVFSDTLEDERITGPKAAELEWDDESFRSVIVNGRHFGELPHSAEEVREIAKMFHRRNDPATIYVHGQASEEMFKREAPRYAFLHVATHGLMHPFRPKLSGLVLARPTDTLGVEDGILRSAEFYELNLNADLVVLSSCESGTGRLVRGEGPMSLVRGLLFAGARNVAFSMWKVLDRDTKEFMLLFYQEVLKGRSYAESMKIAKMKMATQERTSFPGSWAGFVLVGQ